MEDAGLLDRTGGVMRFAGNCQVTCRRQHLAQTFDHDRMVVDQEHRDHAEIRFGTLASSSGTSPAGSSSGTVVSSGSICRSIMTVVPSPGRDITANAAPMAAARSRMLSKPSAVGRAVCSGLNPAPL